MSNSQVINNRFELEKELVKRPSCVVYRAKDTNLGARPVAVKIYLDKPGDNAGFIEKFEKDIAIWRKASHQALVPILEGGVFEGSFYLAMELIEGGTLKDELKLAGSSLELNRAIEIISYVAEGVREIHEAGGVHGAIDSRAVLFKADKPRLAGFYPRVIEEILKSTTTQGRLIVDPAYISPEQVSGSGAIDGRADTYSLSVLLYELVTGERPFVSSNPLQLAMLRLSTEPIAPSKKNSNISPLLDAAILKGLSKKPEDRFSTLTEFIDAINGGRREAKNPLVEPKVANSSERLGAGETVGVSMSVDKIKEMLASHSSVKEAESKPKSVSKGQSPAMEVGATMMGVSSAMLLKGSLMIVEGPGQGKRFDLATEQSIIGSDSTCNVSIKNDKVSQRHAIIVRREDKYFVAPLSGGVVVVNGSEIGGTAEVELKRGDIITLGDIQLRFIAPGEVFTLQSSVAERVIDRKESKWGRFAIIGGVLIVVLGLALVFIFNQQVSDDQAAKKRAAGKKDEQRSQLVDKLRKEGDLFFREGKLIEPVGENARVRFEQILEVIPNDTYAKRRLAEIDARSQELMEQQKIRQQNQQKIQELLASADKYFQAKELIAPPGRNAKEVYEQVIKLDPTNEIAQGRIKEITTLLGSIYEQVERMLVKAKEFKDLGQYVTPKEENAYYMLQQVLKIDPRNLQAKEMLIDMAARSIFQGDTARSAADSTAMKKSYITAQLLGVDPEYLAPRLKGAELIKKSKASVIVYDRKDDSKKDDKKVTDSRYLDTTEIERRLAALSLGSVEDESERRFIDLNSK
jgi:serine/threonine protein kinase